MPILALIVVVFVFVVVCIEFVLGFFFARRPPIFYHLHMSDDGYDYDATYMKSCPTKSTVPYKHWPKIKGRFIWPFWPAVAALLVWKWGVIMQLVTNLYLSPETLLVLGFVVAQIALFVFVWPRKSFRAKRVLAWVRIKEKLWPMTNIVD